MISIRDSSVGIATRYGLGRSGDRIPVAARFSAPAQTSPGAHPASYTMGTGSFPGVKRTRRGVDHPPEVEGRVELYIYSPSGPSWPVLGWPLPLPLSMIDLNYWVRFCSPSGAGRSRRKMWAFLITTKDCFLFEIRGWRNSWTFTEKNRSWKVEYLRLRGNPEGCKLILSTVTPPPPPPPPPPTKYHKLCKSS